MTLSNDTIPVPLAEILADLFTASTILMTRLPPHVATRLPEAARLCDAHALADLCHRDLELMTKILEVLDRPTPDPGMRQPFRLKDISILYRNLSGEQAVDDITAKVSATDVHLDLDPAPRMARLVAATDLAVHLRRLHPGTPALTGATALVMRHALRNAGVMVPLVAAFLSPGPEADADTFLAACLVSTKRVAETLDPALLLPTLDAAAVADLPDLRPVLAALTPGKPLPRGAVPGLTGLPERTARRRIASLLESKWARSDTPKGSLLPDVPPAALATVLRDARTGIVEPVSK